MPLFNSLKRENIKKLSENERVSLLGTLDCFDFAQRSFFFVYIGAQVLASLLFSAKISFTIFSYHFCARECFGNCYNNLINGQDKQHAREIGG